MIVKEGEPSLTSEYEMSARIIRGGPEEIGRFVISVLERSLVDPLQPGEDTVQDKYGPAIVSEFIDIVSKLHTSNPAFRVRFLTDIQAENLEIVKKIMSTDGFEVRHLEGIKAKFGVTRTEYLTTTKDLENGLPDEILWIKSPEIVTQMKNIFQNLWESSIPAQGRIKMLERGLEQSETRVFYDIKEATEFGKELAMKSKKEVLLILASEMALRRNVDLIQSDAYSLADRGVSYRLLAPVSDPAIAKLLDGINWRKIEPLNLGYSIFDAEKMLITEYAVPEGEKKRPDECEDSKIPRTHQETSVIISNTYTTNPQSIHGIISIFEALWRQSETLEREEKARREAQLLQDILAHDIRNYNQVSKLSAELLQEELRDRGIRDDPVINSIVESMQQAIEGSTQLVERARKLGKIMVEVNVKLHSVDLMQAIESAMALVRSAYPNKAINDQRSIDIEVSRNTEEAALVTADELLPEVFANIYSNCIKYTFSPSVLIETSFQEVQEPAQKEGLRSRSWWRVTISDHGMGISDELKANLFSRYLKSAKGSGLGMSIVHALVVERYQGRLKVRNRVPNEYREGTAVEVWLPKVSSSL